MEGAEAQVLFWEQEEERRCGMQRVWKVMEVGRPQPTRGEGEVVQRQVRGERQV